MDELRLPVRVCLPDEVGRRPARPRDAGGVGVDDFPFTPGKRRPVRARPGLRF